MAQITIGGKIGYLNLKTGGYKFVEIVGIEGDNLIMFEVTKQSSYGRGVATFHNKYTENLQNVIKFINTPSIDFKDGRPLLKYRGTNSNVMTDAATAYHNSLTKKEISPLHNKGNN